MRKRSTLFIAMQVVCICTSAISLAGEIEPGKPQLVFRDDFSKDTRTDYEMEGGAYWEKGKLTLAKGGSIERAISGGKWVRIEVAVDLPKPNADQRESELRFWFQLQGASSEYVRLRRTLANGRPAGSVALVAAAKPNGRTAEQLIRESQTASPMGRIRLEYRHGLVSVSAGDACLFLAYKQNGGADVNGVVLESPSHDIAIRTIKIFGLPNARPEYTPEQSEQLTQAKEADQEMVRAYRAGDYAEAAETCEKIMETWRSVLGEQHPEYATSLNNLAFLYQMTGDHRRPQSLFEQALTIRRAVVGEQHPLYSQSLSNLGAFFKSTGDYDQAEPLFLEAIQIDEAVFGKQHSECATPLNNLATLYESMGDHDRAEPLYRRAMAIALSALGEEHPFTATALSNLAGLYQATGRYRLAEPLYKQALEIREAIHGETHPEYASGLNSLAAMYDRMGDYTQALSVYRQAADILKATVGQEHPGYADCLNNIAGIQLTKREFDAAKSLYGHVLEIQKRTLGDTHPGYANTLHNLAGVHRQIGEYAQAELLYRQALAIVEEVLGRQHPRYASCLNNLGLVYKNRRDYRRAIPLMIEARDIWKLRFGEQHADYVSSLSNLGETYVRMGEPVRAAPVIAAAEAAARRNLNSNSVLRSERQQKLSQSRDRWHLDLAISNAVNRQVQITPTLESHWQWKGATTLRQQTYREIASNPSLAPLFESLQEMSRQLSVVAKQTPLPPPRSANEAMHEAYQLKRDNWENRLTRLTRQREGIERQIASASESYRESQETLTVAAIREMIPPKVAFVDFLEYRHLDRDRDDPRESLTGRRFVAFVLRNDREPAMVALDYSESTSTLIEDFRRSLLSQRVTSENRLTATEPGRQLRAKLWVPIEDHLEGVDTVVISPDTALGMLPFAALPGRAPGSYLLEDYRLARLPFAKLIPRLLKQDPPSRFHRGLLALGDVNYDVKADANATAGALRSPSLDSEQGRLLRTRRDEATHWQSLSGFRRELDIVRSLYRQQFGAVAPVKTLSGSRATEVALLQQASGYSTLHLTTHGFFEDLSVQSIGQAGVNLDSSPSERKRTEPFVNTWLPGLLSGLVMAGANATPEDPDDQDDGILRASEIEATSLQGVDLVVLSACETGLGAVAGGEGLTGLQRAFQIAGAKSVVASLWKVEDRATQELMRRFYENLWKKQMSKLDALREAQLWLLRHPVELESMGVRNVTRGMPRNLKPTARDAAKQTGRRRTDPYFWAAFQLSGDWR